MMEYTAPSGPEGWTEGQPRTQASPRSNGQALRCLPVGGQGGGLWPGPAWRGLAGHSSSLKQSVARTAYAAESGQRGSGMVGTSANWTWGCMGDRGCGQGSICWLTAHPTTQSTFVHHRRLFKAFLPCRDSPAQGLRGGELCPPPPHWELPGQSPPPLVSASPALLQGQHQAGSHVCMLWQRPRNCL